MSYPGETVSFLNARLFPKAVPLCVVANTLREPTHPIFIIIPILEKARDDGIDVAISTTNVP